MADCWGGAEGSSSPTDRIRGPCSLRCGGAGVNTASPQGARPTLRDAAWRRAQLRSAGLPEELSPRRRREPWSRRERPSRAAAAWLSACHGAPHHGARRRPGRGAHERAPPPCSHAVPAGRPARPSRRPPAARRGRRRTWLTPLAAAGPAHDHAVARAARAAPAGQQIRGRPARRRPRARGPAPSSMTSRSRRPTTRCWPSCRASIASSAAAASRPGPTSSRSTRRASRCAVTPGATAS